MSYEETDTKSQFDDDISDGEHEFMIEEVVAKEINGKKAYEWKLDYKDENEQLAEGKVLTWPNQIKELLRILGCEEYETDKFRWDTVMQKGKWFFATISHDPDKKNPSKIYRNMKDFKKSDREPGVPF